MRLRGWVAVLLKRLPDVHASAAAQSACLPVCRPRRAPAR